MTRSPNAPRGSVLVFAVVVLAILAMLSTAFLVVVRHAIQASRSSVNYAQADAVLSAGDIRATNVLKTALTHNVISSPNGVISFGTGGDPLVVGATGSSLQLVLPGDTIAANARVGDPGFGGPDYVGALDFFRHDDPTGAGLTTANPPFAVLSLDSKSSLNPNYLNNPAGHFTTSPLRITSTLPTDMATPFYMRANMTEFINPDTKHADPVSVALRKNRTATPPVGAIRGRHFVWVRDLDANFYAVPAMWGLHDPSNASTNYSPAEQKLALGILEYLRHTPASEMMLTPTHDSVGDSWTLQDMQNLSNLANVKYDHVNDLDSSLGHHAADSNYLTWRSDLESYFSVNADYIQKPDGTLQLNALGQPASSFKPAPGAININTAPEEVIQAMLSQIPYSTIYDPVAKTQTLKYTFASYFPTTSTTITPPPCFAELIAKRIIAKRPFLSRMDFEDFAASLLPGDPTDPNFINTPAGAVQFAMSRRIDHEITLAQFMDMPGLPEGDYADGSINPYKGANFAANMLARFNFFLNEYLPDNTTAIVPQRKDCVLTVQAFNNLLNSVSTLTLPCTVVVNVDPYFKTTVPPPPPPTPFAVEIQGNSSLKQLTLGGDDQFIYDPADNTKVIGINTGANGLAETYVYGFSYYSHDNAVQEYKPIRLKDETNPPAPNDRAYCGKFIYGNVGNAYAPQNPAFVNYGIQDLSQWSCIGNGELSGYYDMFFNPFDVMMFDYGHPKDDNMPHSEDEIQIVSSNTAIEQNIHTGLKSDDVQEVDFNATVDPLESYVLVLPGPDLQIQTTPGQNNSTLPGETPGPVGDDRVVQAIRLSLNDIPPDQFDVEDLGDKLYTSQNDHDPFNQYTYIVPAFGSTVLHSTPRPLNPDNTDPKDVDVYCQVIVDLGDKVCQTKIENDDYYDPNQFAIVIGPNTIAETTVWGPIRASQRSPDQALASNASQIPSANLSANRDVAWSPPICFRSRFYATYVLAQGLTTQPTQGPVGAVSDISAPVTTVTFTPNTPVTIAPGSFFAVNSIPVGTNGLPIAGAPAVQHVYTVESVTGTSGTLTLTLSSPLVAPIGATDYAAVYTSKQIGERRVESIYDAYTDQVLWTRSPLTDKRTLGDTP